MKDQAASRLGSTGASPCGWCTVSLLGGSASTAPLTATGSSSSSSSYRSASECAVPIARPKLNGPALPGAQHGQPEALRLLRAVFRTIAVSPATHSRPGGSLSCMPRVRGTPVTPPLNACIVTTTALALPWKRRRCKLSFHGSDVVSLAQCTAVIPAHATLPTGHEVHCDTRGGRHCRADWPGAAAGHGGEAGERR